MHYNYICVTSERGLDVADAATLRHGRLTRGGTTIMMMMMMMIITTITIITITSITIITTITIGGGVA